MKTMAILFAWLALGPAGAQAQALRAFPDFAAQLAEIPKPELMSMKELCQVLQTSRDAKTLVATLRSIDGWARPVSPEDEMLLVAALESLATNPSVDGSVRAKAIDSLGRACVWVRSEIKLKEAVEFLVAVVNVDHPLDLLHGMRVPALMGLNRCVHRIPDFDQRLPETVMAAAFRVLHEGFVAQENVLAMVLVERYLATHGAYGLLRSYAMSSGYEYEVLSPIESGLSRLYGDPNRPAEFRYRLIRTLARVAWARTGNDGSNLQHRSLQVLKNMANLEPDFQLKRLVELYSRERR